MSGYALNHFSYISKSQYKALSISLLIFLSVFFTALTVDAATRVQVVRDQHETLKDGYGLRGEVRNTGHWADNYIGDQNVTLKNSVNVEFDSLAKYIHSKNDKS